MSAARTSHSYRAVVMDGGSELLDGPAPRHSLILTVFSVSRCTCSVSVDPLYPCPCLSVCLSSVPVSMTVGPPFLLIMGDNFKAVRGAFT